MKICEPMGIKMISDISIVTNLRGVDKEDRD